MHLISSFWLPFPFLTIRGVDRGEEKLEFWFLVAVHSMENAGLLLVSRWAYCSSYDLGNFLIQLVVISVTFLISLVTVMTSSKSLKPRHNFMLLCLLATNILAVFASRAFSDNIPIGIVLFDCVLVSLNFMGVLLSVFYVSKIELYAGLTNELPHLPSYGPKVGSIKTSPQAKRHKPSLLFTSLTILTFISRQLSSLDNFHH